MPHSYEREVFLALFQENGWLDLYSLHERFLLSPAQIASALAVLTASRFCEVDGTKAKLNDDGIKWVLKNRRELFMKSGRKWAMPPLEAELQLKVGEPYMPRLKSIDKTFFRKLS